MAATRVLQPPIIQSTGNIQERLLNSLQKPVKKGCMDWFWNKLLNSPNLMKYQSRNNMITEFLSACFTTSVLATDIAAATGLASLPYLSAVLAFEPAFIGASWAGAVIGLPIAYVFAKADADSHTVTSEQIEKSRNSTSSSTIVNFNLMEDQEEPENLLPIMPSITIDGKPIRIDETQWRTATLHLLNDTFKTMNDYLMYIKIIEDKINPYQFLPSWAKPAIKACYYTGLFFAAIHAKAEDFKTTIISSEEKNIRESKSRVGN